VSRKPLYRRLTHFGTGAIAASIYLLCSAIAFAVFHVTVMNELLPADLPIPAFILGLALVVVMMAIGFTLGGFFSRRHKKGQQQVRDKRVSEILALVRAENSPSFSLYLRAFETTGRMRCKADSSMKAPVFDSRNFDDRLSDFETVLAESVETGMPMVALGEPGEHTGAGRVASSQNCWKEEIELLTSSATVILLLPSTRPGTLWEMNFLHSNRLFKKTIIAVPAKHSRPDFLSRDHDEYDWEGSWEALRREMSEKKVELPEYDKGGQLISLCEEGKVLLRTNLKGHVEVKDIKPLLREHLCTMSKQIVTTLK
jgi:hypothetical protein